MRRGDNHKDRQPGQMDPAFFMAMLQSFSIYSILSPDLSFSQTLASLNLIISEISGSIWNFRQILKALLFFATISFF